MTAEPIPFPVGLEIDLVPLKGYGLEERKGAIFHCQAVMGPDRKTTRTSLP